MPYELSSLWYSLCNDLCSFNPFSFTFRKCTHRKTGQPYAVKIISRRRNCSQELKTLQLCQGHPNIIQLQGEFRDEVSHLWRSTVSILGSNYFCNRTHEKVTWLQLWYIDCAGEHHGVHINSHSLLWFMTAINEIGNVFSVTKCFLMCSVIVEQDDFLQHKLLVPLFTFNLLCVVPGPVPDSAFSIFFFCVHFTPD